MSIELPDFGTAVVCATALLILFPLWGRGIMMAVKSRLKPYQYDLFLGTYASQVTAVTMGFVVALSYALRGYGNVGEILFSRNLVIVMSLVLLGSITTAVVVKRYLVPVKKYDWDIGPNEYQFSILLTIFGSWFFGLLILIGAFMVHVFVTVGFEGIAALNQLVAR